VRKKKIRFFREKTNKQQKEKKRQNKQTTTSSRRKHFTPTGRIHSFAKSVFFFHFFREEIGCFFPEEILETSATPKVVSFEPLLSLEY